MRNRTGIFAGKISVRFSTGAKGEFQVQTVVQLCAERVLKLRTHTAPVRRAAEKASMRCWTRVASFSCGGAEILGLLHQLCDCGLEARLAVCLHAISFRHSLRMLRFQSSRRVSDGRFPFRMQQQAWRWLFHSQSSCRVRCWQSDPQTVRKALRVPAGSYSRQIAVS